MSECNHDCSSCSENCGERKEANVFEKKPLHEGCRVGKVFGVVSGKGGVGKSMVTSQLAVAMRREGYNVAILDADITGPSIPKAFGLHNVEVFGDENGMIPPRTKTGIDMISVNLLLGNDETKPVIWRGAMIAGTVQQFWTETIWDVDVLLVDCPPGTGDVPLTVFQSLPLDGVVIVSSPQDLVSMIVSKAANMAKMMNVPVLGLVENMSYVKCPDCGKEIRIFGDSKVDAVAASYNIPVLARLPIDPAVAAAVDAGWVEDVDVSAMDRAAATLEDCQCGH